MCQSCGAAFYGGQDNHYCPDCARKKKLDTVVRIRTCIDCGTEFFGGPRARRCSPCAVKAAKAAKARYLKNDTKRPLGSTDKCAVCGSEYTVTGSRQKYCSEECTRIGLLAWQREHKKGYAKESGQDIKKAERRAKQKKICVYCLREFRTSTSTNLCSDYCRKEQRRINLCRADIKRGMRRNMEKLEEARTKYREKIKND